MSYPPLTLNAAIVLAVVATSRRPVRVPPRDGRELVAAGYATQDGRGVRRTDLALRWAMRPWPALRASQQAAGRAYLAAWRRGETWDGTYPEPGVLRVAG